MHVCMYDLPADFDMLKEVGGSNKSSTIFLNHGPGGMSELAKQVRSVVGCGQCTF